MARTNVPLSALVRNGSLTTPAGTTADQPNGHIIPAAGVTGRIFLRFTNTNGTARVATIKAGVNPPAFRKDEGDLAVSVPATTGDVIVGPLDSAQFVQADGSIWVDLAASFAGTVTAFKLP